MRIVDAFWEKRNLGVDVVEVNCSEQDCAEELSSVLLKIDVPYSVVKVPVGCINLLFAAQKAGYQVIETSFNYECNIKRLKTPDVYNRFLSQVTVIPATEQLINLALEEIKAGLIFSTDRIAIDPFFSKEVAGIRYYNWCKDALNEGADMEVAFYKDEPIAFNISKVEKERKGAVHGLLGGVYSDALNKGIGFLLVHSEVECCRSLGGTICAGSTTSNNLPALRLHMRYGFEIVNSDYVLIKNN